MKRLIAAVIILVFIISICSFSNFYVTRICNQTVGDIDLFLQNGDTKALENSWHIKKEKLEIFANHSFLDKISLSIAELPTLTQSGDTTHVMLVCERIKELTEQIKQEQKFGFHSFY